MKTLSVAHYFAWPCYHDHKLISASLMAAVYQDEKFLGNWLVCTYYGPESFNHARKEQDKRNDEIEKEVSK